MRAASAAGPTVGLASSTTSSLGSADATYCSARRSTVVLPTPDLAEQHEEALVLEDAVDQRGQRLVVGRRVSNRSSARGVGSNGGDRDRSGSDTCPTPRRTDHLSCARHLLNTDQYLISPQCSTIPPLQRKHKRLNCASLNLSHERPAMVPTRRQFALGLLAAAALPSRARAALTGWPELDGPPAARSRPRQRPAVRQRGATKPAGARSRLRRDGAARSRHRDPGIRAQMGSRATDPVRGSLRRARPPARVVRCAGIAQCAAMLWSGTRRCRPGCRASSTRPPHACCYRACHQAGPALCRAAAFLGRRQRGDRAQARPQRRPARLGLAGRARPRVHRSGVSHGGRRRSVGGALLQ